MQINSENTQSQYADDQLRVSLQEIQNRSGNYLYVKRGDWFYLLDAQNVSEQHAEIEILGYFHRGTSGHFSRDNFYMKTKDRNHDVLGINDQLVYVGSQPPKLFSLTATGKNAVSVGYIEVTRGSWQNINWVELDRRYITRDDILFGNLGASEEVISRYEGMLAINESKIHGFSIDGIEIKDLSDLESFISSFGHLLHTGQSHNDKKRHLLTGNMGHSFIMGYWDNTNWREEKLFVDAELFIINPLRIEDNMIEKTYDGYFIINFDRELHKFVGIDLLTSIASFNRESINFGSFDFNGARDGFYDGPTALIHVE